MTIQALELSDRPPATSRRGRWGDAPGPRVGAARTARLVNKREPELPGPDWARVRPLLSGICGSDLATISGQSSFYFSPLVRAVRPWP